LCCHSHNRWYLSIHWESVLNADVLLIACWPDLCLAVWVVHRDKKKIRKAKKEGKKPIYLVLLHPAVLVGKENSGWM